METPSVLGFGLFLHASFNFLASLINGNKESHEGQNEKSFDTGVSFNFLASLINGNTLPLALVVRQQLRHF